MRNNVTFCHPAEFVSISEGDEILSTTGAAWFIDLLSAVPGLEIDSRLCQEDWGVVAFLQRGGKRFWVGLSFWPDGDHSWLAHFHHRSSAWLQRVTKSGNAEFERLIKDFHTVLSNSPSIAEVSWYGEREIAKPNAPGSASPIGA
jgi:hypothetical protein